jgi:hypothetical protein
MLFETKIKVNKNYACPFEKGTLVKLTKDYTTSPGNNEYMVKGCFCKIYECGLDFLYINENGGEKDFVGEGPWCSVDTIIEDSDCKTEEDRDRLLECYDFTGIVRERYLKEIELADLL